ncbi:hypothetical protein V3C99_001279 [Haemonchus contortus]
MKFLEMLQDYQLRTQSSIPNKDGKKKNFCDYLMLIDTDGKHCDYLMLIDTDGKHCDYLMLIDTDGKHSWSMEPLLFLTQYLQNHYKNTYRYLSN